MPIGNVSRDNSTKRESFRPPWVKDKDADAPPPWTQKKLKPVESAAKSVDDTPAAATTVKPLKQYKKKSVKCESESPIEDSVPISGL